MIKKIILNLSALFCAFSLNAEILRRSCDAEPAAMNIHSASDAHTFSILRDLYETLVEFQADGTLRPAAAESWEVSPDGKTYIFKLRQNAKWSNGDPVTAHDFVYSWQQIVTPATACPYGNHAYMIENAEDIVKGKKAPETLGVKALDDYRFEVKLIAPVQHFLKLLYHPPFAPLHRKSKEADPETYTRAGKLVSNGAFKLTDWVSNSIVKTEKNPHYRDASSVKLEAVHYFPVEADSQLLKYRAGELDIATAIPDNKMDFVNRGELKAERVDSPFFGMMYMGYNLNAEPFKNPKIREALSLVIDRERLAHAVLNAGEEPLYGWNYPHAANYKPCCVEFKNMAMKERIERAQKLLKEAGYTSDNPLKFEVSNVKMASRQKILNAVVAMWKEHLPVAPEAINSEYKVYVSDINQKKYQIYLGRLVGLYNDPHTFAELMLKDSGMNMIGYNNQDYDALVKKASVETDTKKREDLYYASETLFLNNNSVIPLTTMSVPKLVKPYVKGFKPSVMDVYYAKDMWLEKQ